MAKKRKKNRSFKVHSDLNGIPFVRFGGKYLTRELDLNYGDRLEMTRLDDRIILRKFSVDEVAEYEARRQERSVLKKLFPIKQKQPVMMVAESRSTYSVEDEIKKQIERYYQAQACSQN